MTRGDSIKYLSMLVVICLLHGAVARSTSKAKPLVPLAQDSAVKEQWGALH